MALANQNTGMVDGLGQTQLVDLRLETALQKVLNLQGQDVIQSHAGLIEHTDADQTANEGIAFEESLRVLLIESKKLTMYPQLANETQTTILFHESAYRAARRIFDRVSWTRHTSRLLRRPYSPMSLSSESLETNVRT